MKKKSRIWFNTLAERKAWEAEQQAKMEAAKAAYTGPVTKCEAGPKPEGEWTAKSKNYLLNGMSPKG